MPQVLVFDDLTVENYQVVHKNLNVENSTLVLDKLAIYHAMAMVLAEREVYSEMKNLKSSFKSEVFRTMFRQMTRHVKSLGNAVKSWPGYEKIGQKLNDIEGKLYDNFVKCTTEEPKGLKLLNHGDFHIRNLMFQLNACGSISNVLFLDFQMPTYHSPAMDLYYFLNAIGDDDVRYKKDVMIKRYHDVLVSRLKLHGFSGTIPSVVDIHIELLRMSDLS